MDYSEQSKTIRELIDIKQPKMGSAPKWILPRVKAAIKAGKIERSGFALTTGRMALEHLTRTCGDSWADHIGMLKYDGYDVLVSEPYAAKLSAQMLNELSTATKVIDAAFLFSARSWHFPGRTIRIYIVEHSGLEVKIRSAENTPGKDRDFIR